MSRETPIHNFTITQGADLSHQLTWQDANKAPIDVTGYTARLIAKENDATDPILIDLTEVNGGIVVGNTNGTFTVVMSEIATAALDFDRANYEIYITSPASFKTRFIQGVITLSKELGTT